jgi:hypothetical protein
LSHRLIVCVVVVLLFLCYSAKGDDAKTNEIRADVYANRAACNVQLYEPVKVSQRSTRTQLFSYLSLPLPSACFLPAPLSPSDVMILSPFNRLCEQL